MFSTTAKATERWPEIGRATYSLGGVCERGTSTMDDLATWESRNLSTKVEYAQRNATNGAESGRGAAVGGPHTSDDDGERTSHPDPEEQRRARAWTTSRREP